MIKETVITKRTVESDLSFGQAIMTVARRLSESGLDANQIASILCKQDPVGENYGVGILLGGDGRALRTSSILLDYLKRELDESQEGVYRNSDSLTNEMKDAVLRWQGVPENLWSHFHLALPSDAGTGALQTAIQISTLINRNITALAVETLSWPAYKALAFSARLRFEEFPCDEAVATRNTLPLYQSGPMNTTGRVPSPEVINRRAQTARSSGIPVVLDRAYPGFEYARRLEDFSYSDVMKKSFKDQIMPFIEEGVTFSIAISPTKAFVSFALRPCGILLVYCPDADKKKQIRSQLASIMRARGSSAEHPVTRAFVRAMIREREKLEQIHIEALRRTAEAERSWEKLTTGTSLEVLFSKSYAGIFRNPLISSEGPQEIYGAHIYPVFSNGRCRLNVTGLPLDNLKAADHISLFSKHCR